MFAFEERACLLRSAKPSDLVLKMVLGVVSRALVPVVVAKSQSAELVMVSFYESRPFF